MRNIPLLPRNACVYISPLPVMFLRNFLINFSDVILQVYLGQDGLVDVYANTTIHPNSPINSDLLLDQNGAYIYIMTKTAVSPQRVQ